MLQRYGRCEPTEWSINWSEWSISWRVCFFISNSKKNNNFGQKKYKHNDMKHQNTLYFDALNKQVSQKNSTDLFFS
jgi:hypothetical protein